MNKKPNKLSTTLTSFWFYSSASILVSLAIAIFFYRLKFSGGLSDNSTDWSNFGSYMGGVFGPLVSFVTLLAVLKTVYMQRELLDTQKQEFIALNSQQVSSLERQDAQLKISIEESQRSSVQDYLSNQFKLIDVLIANQQRQAEAMSEAALKIFELDHGSLAQRLKAAEPALADKDKALGNVKSLIGLSVELSVSEFTSAQEILALVGPRLLKILDLNVEVEKGSQTLE
ncbi:hypothetical protein [Pseudomonas canadensis]|uniref:hypothetical protein n=1 Tax=Pseudomonas canadensis TaxID=915099 RepID=UPI002810DA58|nr:hypothetical protein [Pseudomonas canadensis]